jgi:Zn-dependent peptidase ImmA (M78 family)
LGLEAQELEAELQHEPEPRQSILNSIARELVIPPFVFYMERAPHLHAILPDFRSAAASPRAKSRETMEAIQFAEGVQRAAIAGYAPGAQALIAFKATAGAEVDAFARIARDFFNLSLEDQRDAKDARGFYVVCRRRVEQKGIFVLHASFPASDGSGFCLAHPVYPIIVVNTAEQTPGRRLFTLVHELAHVLMGKSGISDPFIRENATERLCNRFAGAFLVPKDYALKLLGQGVKSNAPSREDVRWAANRLRISQEATVLRLEQLGIYQPGTYEKWKALVHNSNPDFSKKKGGPPVPTPQEKMKLAKYGFQFARAFDALLSSGQINEINLYRATGLKPKYQKLYFAYAKSASDAELREIADE